MNRLLTLVVTMTIMAMWGVNASSSTVALTDVEAEVLDANENESLSHRNLYGPQCRNDVTINFHRSKAGQKLVSGSVVDANVPFDLVKFQARRKERLPDGPFPDGRILETKQHGRVLIINQYDHNYNPKPNHRGGQIEAGFAVEATVKGLTILDVTKAGGTVEFYDGDWVKLSRFHIPVTGHGRKKVLWTRQPNVMFMLVNFVGVGAIDDVMIWRNCASIPRPPCRNDINVDFSKNLWGDYIPRGAIVTKYLPFDGVSFEGRQKSRGTNFRTPWWDGMIFDTNRPSGGDDDLAVRGQGNVLIISEDNNPHNPDDNWEGGWLQARFDFPVKVKSLTFLDIDETGGTVEFFGGRHMIRKMNVPYTGNGRKKVLNVNLMGVSMFRIRLVGSGALDDVRIWRNCQAYY